MNCFKLYSLGSQITGIDMSFTKSWKCGHVSANEKALAKRPVLTPNCIAPYTSLMRLPYSENMEFYNGVANSHCSYKTEV